MISYKAHQIENSSNVLIDPSTEGTLAARLADATFTGRTGEVQATPTVNTVLGRLKDITDNLVSLVSGVVWQREIANGNGYELSSNAISVGGTSEVSFALIKNTSSTKSLRIRLITFTRSSTGAEPAFFRLYRDPTITTNGTALTINNIKKGGAASIATAFHTPTISANGTLLYAAGYTNALVPIDFDLGFLIQPLENLLITVKPDTTNKEHIMSTNWLEVTL